MVIFVVPFAFLIYLVIRARYCKRGVRLQYQ